MELCLAFLFFEVYFRVFFYVDFFCEKNSFSKDKLFGNVPRSNTPPLFALHNEFSGAEGGVENRGFYLLCTHG